MIFHTRYLRIMIYSFFFFSVSHELTSASAGSFPSVPRTQNWLFSKEIRNHIQITSTFIHYYSNQWALPDRMKAIDVRKWTDWAKTWLSQYDTKSNGTVDLYIICFMILYLFCYLLTWFECFVYYYCCMLSSFYSFISYIHYINLVFLWLSG